jgi:hypothetical protein
LPFQGVNTVSLNTQGIALGYSLFGLSGRGYPQTLLLSDVELSMALKTSF